MRIGIDISQIVYEGTGVAKYVKEMVRELVALDTSNEYVLFGASLRKRDAFYSFYQTLANLHRVTLKVYPIPPTVLDIVWNIFHIVPVEWFIGKVDVFWSSDWTQPPLAGTRGLTTIHDLTILRYPESFHTKIVEVHTRRLKRAIKECSMFLCDSIATKTDCIQLLGIAESKLKVVYPGFSSGFPPSRE